MPASQAGGTALGLFFGIEQREFGSLINRNIGAIGDFEQAQYVLRFFAYPLISADGRDAEDVELFGLEEN